MPYYRAYLLDTSGRASGPAYHLICGSDDEAIERARRLVGFQHFELWNVDRLVLRLEGRRGVVYPSDLRIAVAPAQRATGTHSGKASKTVLTVSLATKA